MTEIVPPHIEIAASAEDDPRVGRLLARDLAPGETPRAVIVGFPTDVGVRRNGGRAGAAEGPRAIRQALYRMTPDARAPESFVSLLGKTRDIGDVRVSDDLARDQLQLGAIVAGHLERGTFVIVLGGGHETAYGHFLGYVERGMRVRILNWDAHADVRPLVNGEAHSGSPFRQALEHPSRTCAGYVVAGLQPHAAARTHVEYIESRGGRCVWRPELETERVESLCDSDDAMMVSFDLDAVDQASAPGVSAPAADGLRVEQWLAAAALAGRAGAVRSCDVVELNPALDRDGRTARLAALTVWRILHGLADRR
ncbi:MAG TPA: formimidoylglutamase [Gemmatimonadaceae bacterium]|nr:formimidoylglutamase [Gemmatimonadaceae bacterium]